MMIVDLLRPVRGVIMLAWLSTWGVILSGCASDEHIHEPGQHGGIVLPLGDDHYHAEALFTDEGELKLFMLGQDETEVISVAEQSLTAYVRSGGNAASKPMQLSPRSQPGDDPGTTSLFTGQLPEGASGILYVVVPSIQIRGKKYRFSFTTTDPIMPAKISDEAERDLYLKPGGAYTSEDIAANGSVTASQKYSNFRSAHDMHPQTGDRICPITQTKANPACTWIIGGREYQFCCPPCIDEFVKLAKEEPGAIHPPDQYLQR